MIFEDLFRFNPQGSLPFCEFLALLEWYDVRSVVLSRLESLVGIKALKRSTDTFVFDLPDLVWRHFLKCKVIPGI